jgi:hypothetical protein
MGPVDVDVMEDVDRCNKMTMILTLEPIRQRNMANFVPLLSNSVPQASFWGETEKSFP